MRYATRRFAQLLIVLLAVTFLASVALRFLPGGSDAVVALISGGGGTPEQVEQIKNDLGLNDPIITQWFNWTVDLVTLDWGQTFASNQSIESIMWRALPISAYLMLYGQLLALGLAIPVAMLAAYRQNTGVDRFAATSAFGLLATPNYILAPIMILLFSVNRKWIPFPSTYVSLFEDPVGHFKAFVLPSICIGLPLYAGYMRLLRADLIGTLQSDFITTARAKGASTTRILTRHALRPSLFSLVTAAAVNTGALMGGVVVVETIFSLNGMGRITVNSIFARELPTVQYGVAVIALFYVLINFVVDLTYAWIDPRVRAGRALA